MIRLDSDPNSFSGAVLVGVISGVLSGFIAGAIVGAVHFLVMRGLH